MKKAANFFVFFLILLFQLLQELNCYGQHAHFTGGNDGKLAGRSNSFYPDSKRSLEISSDTCKAKKMIFGYHPYWVGTAWHEYHWNLLTDLCYFSYESDPSTGNPVTLNGWDTDPVIDTALKHNTRVHLCVTQFYGHSQFFNNPEAQQTLISNVTNLLKSRGAMGVNLDFEAVPGSLAEKYNTYMAAFADSLHAAIPGVIVSIATPAVDWEELMNIALLSHHIDYFMVMGYDYYWNSSTVAGPVGGLYPMENNYPYSLSGTLSWYLSKGTPTEKILLGLPYYGRDWPVDRPVAPANALSNATAHTYSFVRNNPYTYSSSNKHLESNSLSPYYSYRVNNEWHQCFMDDERSLGMKFELVNRSKIAGIGIWALGYDEGTDELWNLISDRFSDCAVPLCSDTLYDSGGPAFNYQDNESYSITISIAQGEALNLEFLEFDLETGQDSLQVFDGSSVDSPLIGSYSDTAIPDLLYASSHSLTLCFNSGPSGNNSGWKAVYRCPSAGIPLGGEPLYLVAYPNPCQSGFMLRFNSRKEEWVGIKLTDIAGRQIMPTQQFQAKYGYNERQVNFQPALPSGLYLGTLVFEHSKAAHFKIIRQ